MTLVRLFSHGRTRILAIADSWDAFAFDGLVYRVRRNKRGAFATRVRA